MNLNEMINNNFTNPANSYNYQTTNNGNQFNNNYNSNNNQNYEGPNDYNMNQENFDANYVDEKEQLDLEEKEFLKRVKVGSGAGTVKKYIHILESRDGLFMPTSRLGLRDLARHGLGLVKSIYKEQVKISKFEREIPGCTDYSSLMNWLLNNKNTRPYIFTKIRTVRFTQERIEAPTKVNIEYLTAVALNFGGSDWTEHYNRHNQLMDDNTYTNNKFKVASYMHNNPKYIKADDSKKRSELQSSLSRHMDRELVLGKDSMFKELYLLKIVTSLEDYNRYIEKVQHSGIVLNGNESAAELNKKLQENMMNNQQSSKVKYDMLKRKLQTDLEIAKERFLKSALDLGIDDINANWFSDFDVVEYNTLADHIEYCSNRVNNALVDPYERQIGRDFLIDYILTWFDKRKKE